MSWVENVPGVYRQEVVLRPETKLMTGVVGFVGFAEVSGADKTTPVVALHRRDEFAARVTSTPGGYLADAVAGFFLNGGLRCYVACAQLKAADSDTQKAAALLQALEALAPLTDLDLVAIPDVMMIYWPDAEDKLDVIHRLQLALLQHCEVNLGRLAILDALPADTQTVIEQRCRLASGIKEPINGALYYPWIRTDDGRLVPPCGHVAGIYARSDGRAGVFKAPANEEVQGALDLGILVKKAGREKEVINDAPVTPDQAALNRESINCLRALPGRGIRVWGARTLSRDTSWRYINVRRLFLTLQHWLDLNMNWVSFEPNMPMLWIRITREIDVYLNQVWRDGGLAGQTAEEGFYVKCDGETNPPAVREAGQVITEIGLAPALPSEFIVVRIVQHTAVEPR
jgi:Bacteriophage tail sheath protein